MGSNCAECLLCDLMVSLCTKHTSELGFGHMQCRVVSRSASFIESACAPHNNCSTFSKSQCFPKSSDRMNPVYSCYIIYPEVCVNIEVVMAELYLISFARICHLSLLNSNFYSTMNKAFRYKNHSLTSYITVLLFKLLGYVTLPPLTKVNKDSKLIFKYALTQTHISNSNKF